MDMVDAQEHRHNFHLAQQLRETFGKFIEICLEPNDDLEALQKEIDEYTRMNHDVSVWETVSEFKDSQGRALLHFAAQTGNTNIVQWILDIAAGRGQIDVPDEQGVTPLMLAAQGGHEATVSLLLSRGSQVNTTSQDGATAVHYAATTSNMNALSALCAQNPNLQLESRAGTPLHWAAGAGNDAAIQILLAAGSNVNAHNQQGLSPVIMAAAKGSDASVTLLVNAGADTGAVLSGNLTVLHICAELGCIESVRAILATDTGKQCVKIITDEGKTAAHLAAAENHRDIVEILIPYCDNITCTADELIAQAAADEAAAATANDIVADTEAEISSTQPHKTLSTSPAANEEDSRKAQEFKDLGNAAYQRKEYSNAVELYTKSLQLDGSNHTVWSNRSAVYLLSGDADQALEDALVCRNLKPDWAKACYRMAVARLALKRYEDAAVAAYEGMQIEPENEELRSLLQKAVKLGRAEHQANTKRLLLDTLQDLLVNRPNIHMSRSKVTRAFVEWAKTHFKEAFPASLHIDYHTSKGYRVILQNDAPKHTRLLSVPPDIWIPCSAQFAFEDAKNNAPELMQRIVQLESTISNTHTLSHTMALALRIMMHWQGHISSPHDAYYSFVKECIGLSSHPLLRSDDDIALLKGTATYHELNKRRGFYNKIIEHTFGKDLAVSSDLMQAIAVILSRAVSGESMPFTLVPYLDLLNHDAKPNCRHYYDASSASFIAEAQRDISAGEELTISYGNARDNISMMCVYGFIQEGNTNDVINLPLSHLIPTDPKIRQLLQQFHLSKDGVCHVKRSHNGAGIHDIISANTLPFLRLCCLQNNDNNIITSLQEGKLSPWREMSRENEAKAVHALLHEAISANERVVIASSMTTSNHIELQGGTSYNQQQLWMDTCNRIRTSEGALLKALIDACSYK